MMMISDMFWLFIKPSSGCNSRPFHIQLAIFLKYEIIANCISKHLELQPEDGFIKKRKHVANTLF